MCFSSTPVPPTAAKIFVLSNSDSVVRDSSDRFPIVKRKNSSVCQVGHGGTPLGDGVYPTGGLCVPHWGTVCTPLGDGVYPTGGRCVPRWGTVRTPTGDGVYPTGGRGVPHWGTGCTPPGDGVYPTGRRCVPHWGTVGTFTKRNGAPLHTGFNTRSKAESSKEGFSP
jgi:hypothetical protein